MLRDHLCGCAPLPLLFCWWPACRGASVRTNRAERWLQPRRPTTQLSHRECPLRTRRLRRDSRETRRWARPLHRLPVKLRSRARLRPRRWPRRWPRHRIDPRPAVGRPAARESAAFSSRGGRGTPMAAPGKTSSFECRRQPPSRNSGYMCSPTTHGYTLCDYLAPVERPRVQSAPSPYLL